MHVCKVALVSLLNLCFKMKNKEAFRAESNTLMKSDWAIMVLHNAICIRLIYTRLSEIAILVLILLI